MGLFSGSKIGPYVFHSGQNRVKLRIFKAPRGPTRMRRMRSKAEKLSFQLITPPSANCELGLAESGRGPDRLEDPLGGAGFVKKFPDTSGFHN